ncbi:hypothetical protein BT69DRAFT_1328031 [Atractiella rhizophila]|nr:hypothetical protein BT69DRAFT_1328031 [Atractiella rhizophila]
MSRFNPRPSVALRPLVWRSDLQLGPAFITEDRKAAGGAKDDGCRRGCRERAMMERERREAWQGLRERRIGRMEVMRLVQGGAYCFPLTALSLRSPAVSRVEDDGGHCDGGSNLIPMSVNANAKRERERDGTSSLVPLCPSIYVTLRLPLCTILLAMHLIPSRLSAEFTQVSSSRDAGHELPAYSLLKMNIVWHKVTHRKKGDHVALQPGERERLL